MVPLDDTSHFASNRSLREKELLIRKLEQYRGGQDDDGAGHDHDGDVEEATCESLKESGRLQKPCIQMKLKLPTDERTHVFNL